MSTSAAPTRSVQARHPALTHPVFRGLDADRLLPHLERLRVRRYAPSETVALPGSRRPLLNLVLSGRLCLFEPTPDGRRVILDFVEGGSLDGMLAVAGLRGHFTEASVASDVMSISRSQLDAMLADEPGLAVNLLWALARRLQRRDDQLESIAVRDPGQRLAGLLLILAENLGEPRDGDLLLPRLSHEALAGMLGVRRETVTLHLARLRRTRAVVVRRDRFHLDQAALQAMRDGQAIP